MFYPSSANATHSAPRAQWLDILRGVAVLLVLVQHAPPIDQQVLGWHWWLFLNFKWFGWSGVDLFFVLSGFLVGGLLCAEYRRDGRIDPSRFLLRRGFKIYPAFYTLLAVTGILQATGLGSWGVPLWIGELFFLQNYVGTIWGHTWSLAVEEHFYLLIAAFFWIGSRTGMLKRYWLIAGIAAVVMTAPLICRTWFNTAPFEYRTHLFPTHLRIDSLAFGVILASFWHFHRESTVDFVRRWRWFLLALTAACLAPLGWYAVSDPWMYGPGLTVNAIGFGTALILGMCGAWQLRGVFVSPLSRLFSSIGIRSYSIYLWHLSTLYAVKPLVPKHWTFESRFYLHTLLYLAGSIMIGFILERLIEVPALQLREHLIPRGGKSVEPVLCICEQKGSNYNVAQVAGTKRGV